MNRLEGERLRMQAELDGLRTRRERNTMGQFATPGPLASEILRSARSLTRAKRGRVRFLDPAFGTGSFYSALLDVFPNRSITAAYGFEIDPHYGAPASRLWEATGLQLKLADFTTRNPRASGAEEVDLLVCNPPYVRHHHIEQTEKLRLSGEAMQEVGIRVSGLAGLYVYFMLLSHKWLAADGLSIWLIPSEFMDVNYGSALKAYLLNHVDLIRIHRFDPSEGQFEDALVSSAVVWFRNRRPSPDSSPEFSLGGSLLQPRLRRQLPRSELHRERKWTRFPRAAVANEARGPTLGEFFAIKRGIATGANSFFIMDERKARAWSIPSRFLQPVLPSPRYVKGDVIKADPDGAPRIDRPLFVLRCHQPLDLLERTEPGTAEYIRCGEQQGISEGYLASRRDPWYSLEARDKAPFLCTYMGRSSDGRAPFRVILNESQAIATNVYLMLYPRGALRRTMAQEPDSRAVRACLQRIVDSDWKENGRVYGGGLYKVEPRELGRLPANVLLDAFPMLSMTRSEQIPLEFAGDSATSACDDTAARLEIPKPRSSQRLGP